MGTVTLRCKTPDEQLVAKAQAAKDADRILASVWGGWIPVDPVRIARGLGIRVVDAPLDNSVSGALVKEQGQDATILLNAGDSPNRKRFTCAHEIGHFVRRREQPDEYEYVDYRADLASTGSDAEEVYANQFAASLLMPESEVRAAHRAGLDDLDMAIRFGVSREAMQYRLRNLGLE